MGLLAHYLIAFRGDEIALGVAVNGLAEEAGVVRILVSRCQKDVACYRPLCLGARSKQDDEDFVVAALGCEDDVVARGLGKAGFKPIDAP